MLQTEVTNPSLTKLGKVSDNKETHATRIHLVMQSTGLCRFRVRALCISSSMETKIQFLIRVTNTISKPISWVP